MSETSATRALRVAGVRFETVAYDYDPDAASVGMQAARAIGVPPEALFKTLVVEAGGRFAVAVLDSAHELDPKAFASAWGVRKAALATRADARRVTGYVIGGVSPFGQRRPLPAFVDAAVTAFDRVHVNGGRRGLLVALAPAALVTACGATLAAIRRESGA